MKKQEIEGENYRLKLLIKQQLVNLGVLRHIPEIKENTDVLACLDLAIFKLWDGCNSKEI
jgi:hypothetical protein